jgi:hypothetical protein
MPRIVTVPRLHATHSVYRFRALRVRYPESVERKLVRQ